MSISTLSGAVVGMNPKHRSLARRRPVPSELSSNFVTSIYTGLGNKHQQRSKYKQDGTKKQAS